ncbi:hypothetical protein AYO20_07088 [Fonsecaea nubica]|uniref:Uncharacterized protein n=1 Tax=Fonsecaea nubica TaxID=856822 RepID=A0A178CXB9_9EURO|nr:hypothetical protein AYO20_07088 [Fonsecaea nubica]OAL33581.1 hypothetical protein AYO20_07088 [Fonsecaea nubica]
MSDQSSQDPAPERCVGGEEESEEGKEKKTEKKTGKKMEKKAKKHASYNDRMGKKIKKPQRSKYDGVEALLLTFENHDLKDLNTETIQLLDAFKKLGYKAKTFDTPMKNSESALHKEVDNFLSKPREKNKNILLIIYYHGHGGVSSDGLEFVSHNIPDDTYELGRTMRSILEHLANANNSKSAEATQCIKCAGSNGCTNCTIGNDRTRKNITNEWKRYQPVARVKWHYKDQQKPSLRTKILDAQNDTLVILDCCNAGLATVGRAWQGVEMGDYTAKIQESDEKLNPYRKELIGACGWDVATANWMTRALLQSLEYQLRDKLHAVSMPTVVRDMNTILGDKFLEAGGGHRDRKAFPQTVHYLLDRTRRGRILLEALKKPEWEPGKKEKAKPKRRRASY